MSLLNSKKRFSAFLTILLTFILFSILLSGFFNQLAIYTQYPFKNDEKFDSDSLEAVNSAFNDGYAQNTDNLFFVVKETADSTPNTSAHLKTTLTRVPNFSLYTEGYVSVHGINHQSIDILSSQFAPLECPNISPEQRNIPIMLAHAFATVPSSIDWFVLMDSSHTYIFLKSLAKYLSTMDPSKPLFLGTITGGILSRAAVKQSLEQNNNDNNMVAQPRGTCSGNLAVIKKLQDMKKTQEVDLDVGFQDMTLFKDFITNPGAWCAPMYATRYNTPAEVNTLWALEYSVKDDIIRGSHLYNAFVAGHIKARIPNWDNFANDITLSQENYNKALIDAQFSKTFKAHLERSAFPMDDAQSPSGFVELEEEKNSQEMSAELQRPWSSEIQCKNACDRWARCYSWQYSQQSQKCGLGTSIHLGEALIESSSTLVTSTAAENEVSKMDPDTVSGYQMDRIEALLKNPKCKSTA